jgi:hypothetical protein
MDLEFAPGLAVDQLQESHRLFSPAVDLIPWSVSGCDLSVVCRRWLRGVAAFSDAP